MKWIYLLAAAVLTAIFGLPFRAYDTEKLLPVRTVQAARTEGGAVRLVTEIGTAEGATWAEAVAALRESASGDVFFDTAEQLVACSPSLLPDIVESGDLRPAAQVYFADAPTDPEGLNAYLRAHESGRTIADVRYALLREERP